MADRGRTTRDQVRALADGSQIPVLGLGVWQIPEGAATVNAVRWALEVGYRHIDTAQAYGNEEGVGRGLRESGVSREEVFITTKFWPGAKDPVAELERSLRKLRVEHVDLYLVHWPERGPTWMWPGMEGARQQGLTRSIGVSNYGARELEEVIASARVPPVLNQVEFSPFAYRRRLLDAGNRHHVATEAYSPLGTGRHLSDPTVRRLAAAMGRTPAQVLLRWGLQHNLIVIPKSTHRARIEENARVFDFELSDRDMAALDSLDRTGASDRAVEDQWW